MYYVGTDMCGKLYKEYIINTKIRILLTLQFKK